MVEAELLVGVKTLWDSDATLTSLVPGGLHEGRVGVEELPAGEANRVYARQTVALEGIEYNSGAWTLNKYRLELMVWSRPGAGAVAAGAFMRAMDAILERSRRADLQLGANLVVVDIVRLPANLAEDEAVKEAQDVYVAGAAYEITVFVPRTIG